MHPLIAGYSESRRKPLPKLRKRIEHTLQRNRESELFGKSLQALHGARSRQSLLIIRESHLRQQRL